MFTLCRFLRRPCPFVEAQTLHCTILLENKRAQHGNVSREMEKETERDTYLQPGCSGVGSH